MRLIFKVALNGILVLVPGTNPLLSQEKGKGLRVGHQRVEWALISLEEKLIQTPLTLSSQMEQCSKVLILNMRAGICQSYISVFFANFSFQDGHALLLCLSGILSF